MATGEKRSVDPDVVPSVGNGHQRNGRQSRESGSFGIGQGCIVLLFGFFEFFEADEYGKKSKKSDPWEGDGEGSQISNKADRGQGQDPDEFANDNRKDPVSWIREKKRDQEQVVDIRGYESQDADGNGGKK